MQAKARDLEKSSESHYLFDCERRDFGERHLVCLLGRVLQIDEKVVRKTGRLPTSTPRSEAFWARFRLLEAFLGARSRAEVLLEAFNCATLASHDR